MSAVIFHSITYFWPLLVTKPVILRHKYEHLSLERNRSTALRPLQWYCNDSLLSLIPQLERSLGTAPNPSDWYV